MQIAFYKNTSWDTLINTLIDALTGVLINTLIIEILNLAGLCKIILQKTQNV